MVTKFLVFFFVLYIVGNLKSMWNILHLENLSCMFFVGFLYIICDF